MRRWNGKRKWWLRRGSQVRTGGGRLDAALERVAALVRGNLTTRNILRSVEWEPEDV